MKIFCETTLFQNSWISPMHSRAFLLSWSSCRSRSKSSSPTPLVFKPSLQTLASETAMAFKEADILAVYLVLLKTSDTEFTQSSWEAGTWCPTIICSFAEVCPINLVKQYGTRPLDSLWRVTGSSGDAWEKIQENNKHSLPTFPLFFIWKTNAYMAELLIGETENLLK